ncbi:MAG TPA: MBL fold metallo-hydrolase [Miltoncostaeaceae bacterium]|nr:MBL fold metallo-hydrolase [Miltoncostaeaceae bacterium]
MVELAPGVRLVDSLLGGREGLTSVYLVAGERLALVDTGAQTSAGAVLSALAEEGVGPDDLAHIVLTHIHLDHCGGTGDLARAFPRARVAVHERGARHLAEPARLVAASHAVYGPKASLYGGLEPVPADRIDVAPDGYEIDLGGGRVLRMLATPGHARHHMSVLETGDGTLMSGDALGVEFGAGGLYPSTPPSDVDVPAARASIARLAAEKPATVALAHFGPPTADDAFALSDERWARMGEAALRGHREAGGEGAVAAVLEAAPLHGMVDDEAARRIWEWLGWDRDNLQGLAAWAARQAEAEDAAG